MKVLLMKKTITRRYLSAISSHKNFEAELVDGDLFLDEPHLLNDDEVMKAAADSPKRKELYMEFFKITQDEFWLPQEAKDLFIF